MSTLLSDENASRAEPLHAVPPPMRRAVFEFARYFVASAGALAVDFGLYRLALGLGIAYSIAAVIGFCAGAVVAYVASVVWVFETRSIHRTAVEFFAFVAIGIAGLGLTEALLWLEVERLGIPPLWSKAVAAGVVFVFNFGVRRYLLFRGRSN